MVPHGSDMEQFSHYMSIYSCICGMWICLNLHLLRLRVSYMASNWEWHVECLIIHVDDNKGTGQPLWCGAIGVDYEKSCSFVQQHSLVWLLQQTPQLIQASRTFHRPRLRRCESLQLTMTERQAVQESGATGYFVIQFCEDWCVCAIPAKIWSWSNQLLLFPAVTIVLLGGLMGATMRLKYWEVYLTM